MTVVLHLDEVDGEAVWWAETPGFTAAATSLTELRQFVTEAHPGVVLTERLDAPEIDGVRQVLLRLP